jgi:ATP-binding cassette subfamily B protein
MRRLLKYLKPYLILIVLAVGLLFVQANAELALPDYLSRIVNNGIQQNGVENAVAMAFRQDTLNRLVLFMNPDDGRIIIDSYRLIKPDTPEAVDLAEVYPLLEEESIYILTDVDPEKEEQLDGILGKSLLAYSGLQQLLEDPSALALLAERLDIDPALIPPGTDIFQVLENLPASTRQALASRMEDTFASLGESMIAQMAVGVVKEEYEALGIAKLYSKNWRHDAVDFSPGGCDNHRGEFPGI